MSRTARPLVVTSSENPLRGKVEKTKRTPQQSSKSHGRNPLANITNIPGVLRSTKPARSNVLVQLPPLVDQDDEVLFDDHEIEDIDANDQEDPQAVTEYVNEIYEYSFAQEVPTNFLTGRPRN